jgi:hypothetical protein
LRQAVLRKNPGGGRGFRLTNGHLRNTEASRAADHAPQTTDPKMSA